jgi:hypothetical protein
MISSIARRKLVSSFENGLYVFFNTTTLPGGRIHITLEHPNAKVKEITLRNFFSQVAIKQTYTIIPTGEKSFLVFSTMPMEYNFIFSVRFFCLSTVRSPAGARWYAIISPGCIPGSMTPPQSPFPENIQTKPKLNPSWDPPTIYMIENSWRNCMKRDPDDAHNRRVPVTFFFPPFWRYMAAPSSSP